jgi:hypothetical protein
MSIVISIIQAYAQERDVLTFDYKESKRSKGAFHFELKFPTAMQAHSFCDRADKGWSQVLVSEILQDEDLVVLIAREKEVKNA